jgi:DNA topoisomerase VI subunit B
LPLVILKELVDNALDACEEAGTAPVIEIIVSDAGIVISDRPRNNAGDGRGHPRLHLPHIKP